jgi:hypothetical protein
MEQNPHLELEYIYIIPSIRLARAQKRLNILEIINVILSTVFGL